MVVVDSESLEVLFDSQNLISAKNVLMSAHHLSGAGGPPFDPLRLFRFKIVLFCKATAHRGFWRGKLRARRRRQEASYYVQHFPRRKVLCNPAQSAYTIKVNL